MTPENRKASLLTLNGDGKPPDERRVLSVRTLGAIITAAVTLLFFSTFWNHFVGIRSGSGAYGGGSAFLAGIYPYRDYFMAATPLNQMKSAAALYLFGNTMAALRAFDVLERTGLGLLGYFWLAQLFRGRDAAIAMIVTILISTCDYADAISSYNHDALLLGVAGGVAANFVVRRRLPVWGFVLAAVSSGFFSGLSFDTKQTIG